MTQPTDTISTLVLSLSEAEAANRANADVASTASLYVYKCNDDPHTTNAAYGDWQSTLKWKSPFAWGGAFATRSAYSKRLFEDELEIADLILAWQVDTRVAIGVLEVMGFHVDAFGSEHVLLTWREVFATPVPINDLKRTKPRLRTVKAFKQGFAATLYDTTKQEAHDLLTACGSRFASMF